MLKYKVKMFFLLLYWSMVKNIVFKYIMLKLYGLNIIFDFWLGFFLSIIMLIDWKLTM